MHRIIPLENRTLRTLLREKQDEIERLHRLDFYKTEALESTAKVLEEILQTGKPLPPLALKRWISRTRGAAHKFERG